MPSTTVEKAIFIIFGLAIFSTIGIPIFNSVQEIIENESHSREFDATVARIEIGFRIVEYNGSALYSSHVNVLAGMVMNLEEDSWALKVEYTGGQMHLVKYIYSRCCPITLTCDNAVGECVLLIEKINGFISVQFTKEGV